MNESWHTYLYNTLVSVNKWTCYVLLGIMFGIIHSISIFFFFPVVLHRTSRTEDIVESLKFTTMQAPLQNT